MATNDRILSGSVIDLAVLARLSRRPDLFEPSELSFWQDPYVSSHVLEAHLDPDTTAASHPPEIIDRRVNWLCSRCDLHAGMRILDLGCGPGFYCERFSLLGMDVTGIDYGPSSHRYAVECAEREGLSIDYRFGNFTDIDIGNSYDLITLIYGDFCTLTREERSRLLTRVRKVLNPGGFIALDVFTKTYLDGRPESPGWYVSEEDGFWRADIHAVLEQRLEYEDDEVLLDRYLVFGQDGVVSDFRVWNSYYTADGVGNLLHEAGFASVDIYGDLSGEPLGEVPDWIAVVASVN